MLPTSSTPKGPLPMVSSFLHTCGFCGCVFRVEITWRTAYSYKASQDTQDYSCPECLRNSRIKTSSEPQVVLVSKRTDGRTSRCPVN